MFGNPARWVRLLLAVGGLLLLVVISIVIYVRLTSCGPDVRRIDDQCIGVTDGQVELTPGVRDVLGKIRAENQRVDAMERGAVNVAYLVALPKPSSDPGIGEIMRHELQGAHIAQLQTNNTNTLGERPLVRLLVANYGDKSSQWKEVVPDLVDRMRAGDLVATVVTGQSLRPTQQAIDALRSAGVPVIASRLTANSLSALANPGDIQGLARVAPTNNNYAAAAAAYLRPQARSALIVQDRNPADTYLLSLGEAFRRAFTDETHKVLNPPELYNSQLGGVANRMVDIIENICVRQPDIVFFAGRSPDLAAFVEALGIRNCPEVPVNVMTAGDAVEFANTVADRSPELVRGLETNASVTYTAQAHPGSWSGAPEYFNPGAVYQLESRFTRVFPREELGDGAPIIGYDAIVLAVKAIRIPEGIGLPSEIIQRFNGLNGNDMVAGAGGYISIDRYGNTMNKAVAILQAQPDGTVMWLGVSSSTGSPCVPNPPGQC